MFQTVLPTIAALFASDEKHRAPVNFSWRLVRRKGRPFLLLPDPSDNTRVSLELYSAQRPLARLWRSLIPALLKTPARTFFGAVHTEAEASSALLRFFAEQSGQPAGELPTPAIKFGGIAGKTSRVVVLLCDTAGHPIRVVKVGLNPKGRAATEREAALLAQLPQATLGCTAMTGQLKTGTLSAFATAYFPGQSLTNDAGIEKLFHTWLTPGSAAALEDFSSWHELAAAVPKKENQIFPALREALAGKKVSVTLFHGDFTPWNVRMTNLENIQAFDWERGHLNGIPGWDWFHFIIQTSILVKRHSPERVAAELDHLIQSARFQKYAQAAGIGGIIEPLLLAYLLHEKYVVQPREGSEVIDQLFHLLWQQWQLKKNPATPARATGEVAPTALPLPVAHPHGVLADVKSALANLANLFWEPSLSPQIRPTLLTQLHRHWFAMLVSLAWIFGVANLPLLTNPHLMFAPFYLVPCIFLALKTDRRLATVVAQLSAVGGPLTVYFAQPGFTAFDVTCWNIAMRMVVFQLVVVLFDRLSRQSLLRQPHDFVARPNQVQPLAGNWPVIVFTVLIFAVVVAFDAMTNPHLLLMPLYMIPCMILTLALNWRWGTVAAVLAAILGPLLQRPDPGYQPLNIEFWNTIMRLLIYQTVVLLLEQVRRKNILFYSSRRQ